MKKALLALAVAAVGLTVGATQLWATNKATNVIVEVPSSREARS